MSKYTNQELFDLVVGKLVAQGEACVKEENGEMRCAYVNGTKRCAAGHLIPDDLIGAVGSSPPCVLGSALRDFSESSRYWG